MPHGGATELVPSAIVLTCLCMELKREEQLRQAEVCGSSEIKDDTTKHLAKDTAGRAVTLRGHRCMLLILTT